MYILNDVRFGIARTTWSFSFGSKKTVWHSTYWINQCVLGHGAIWRQSWPLVQSLSIHKSDGLRYLSFYKTHLFILLIPFSTMTFPCCPNLTRHRTFNAGALVGVAISCHHRILHQLVRDRAAEILRVRHQPLHLKKMHLENWSGKVRVSGWVWCVCCGQ